MQFNETINKHTIVRILVRLVVCGIRCACKKKQHKIMIQQEKLRIIENNYNSSLRQLQCGRGCEGSMPTCHQSIMTNTKKGKFNRG